MNIIKNITSTNRTTYNNREIKYIVIHYVGAVSSAKANSNYFKSTYRGASAHYFVDDNEIYQVVEEKDAAWHCGATYYKHLSCRNSNSIGIEMCCFNNNGKMEYNDEKKINGYYYVFDENGLMLDNWVEFTKSSTATPSEASKNETIWKFYRPSNGDRMDGWVWLDEKSEDDEGKDTEEGWYYFKNGVPYTSNYKTTEIADGYGVAKINSKIYCFDENGLMTVGKIDGADGTYYYFDEDQDDGSMKYGKVKITDSDDLDEGTYYFADKGSLGEKGQSQTGVFKGYLYDNGVLVQAEDGMRYEVVEVDGKQYLVNESGKVKTSGTATDDDGVKYQVSKDENGDYIITVVEED